ncbi:MAG: isoprenylcysteine carboxylmethyltransferase family protein [Candidatus Dormiibacterota bacterium]
MSTHPSTAKHGPDVVAPPPLLFLGPLLVGLALDRLLPPPRLPRELRPLGAPLLAGGIALVVWFFTTMRASGTPVDPRQAPTNLVEKGPFKFTRNPGYLGMGLIYSGLSLLTGGRWPLLLLPGVLLVVDRGVIQREERYLGSRFGSPYADYRARVRRWV